MNDQSDAETERQNLSRENFIKLSMGLIALGSSIGSVVFLYLDWKLRKEIKQQQEDLAKYPSSLEFAQATQTAMPPSVRATDTARTDEELKTLIEQTPKSLVRSAGLMYSAYEKDEFETSNSGTLIEYDKELKVYIGMTSEHCLAKRDDGRRLTAFYFMQPHLDQSKTGVAVVFTTAVDVGRDVGVFVFKDMLGADFEVLGEDNISSDMKVPSDRNLYALPYMGIAEKHGVFPEKFKVNSGMIAKDILEDTGLYPTFQISNPGQSGAAVVDEDGILQGITSVLLPIGVAVTPVDTELYKRLKAEAILDFKEKFPEWVG